MGIDDDNWVVSVPSRQEVHTWTTLRPSREACTEESFQPDLTSSPGTPWNQSHVKVFVKSFLDFGAYHCTNRDQLKKAFATHLKSLRRKYQKQQLTEARRKERQRKANREERKRNLFYRRLDVTRKYEHLRQHGHILRRLGVSGMSSDESDHENGISQYRVIQKHWRSPALTPWLRVFDAIHRRTRFGSANARRAGRGARPRLRVDGNGVNFRSAPVPGLPHNAYSHEWLLSLPRIDRDDLVVGNVAYDFSHPADMEMLAMQNYNGAPSRIRNYI
ncbi:hypothetical protein HGRIS_014682 [Hohenbuehelia grisea]|uniref:Uncharacterized protein n=1 Tax=Hohenbuehelia grisea TaxID=104357 RepID=A0ABR3JW03_9AGAR